MEDRILRAGRVSLKASAAAAAFLAVAAGPGAATSPNACANASGNAAIHHNGACVTNVGNFADLLPYDGDDDHDYDDDRDYHDDDLQVDEAILVIDDGAGHVVTPGAGGVPVNNAAVAGRGIGSDSLNSLATPSFTTGGAVAPGSVVNNNQNIVQGQPDGMGDHTATMNVNLASHDIVGINATYANVYYSTSDRRLKTAIRDIDGGLDMVMQLRPVIYRMKADGRVSTGFVAQEVEAQYPYMVTTNPETGMMSVEYIQVVAPLVSAVQQLEARITELEAELQRVRMAAGQGQPAGPARPVLAAVK